MTVLDAIHRATERDAHRIAVVYGPKRLRYRELVERSRSLARHLVALGIGPEHRVAVAIEPSLWAPIAMLAVLEAGAAYVPLEPSYPPARLRDMLDQIDAPLILTTAASAARVPATSAPILSIDHGWPAADAELRPVRPDALAYVIFTSGSTGRPKGVMIGHRGLANLVRAQIEMFAIESHSVVLQFAPLGFDASVSEVFTALAAGATLCMADRDALAPGPRLGELARRHRITVATLPPSSLALLDPADFPTLRTIVSAGEACSAALVARWAPGRRFVNAYGPTEVTVCATMGVCEVDPEGRPPGIGEALHGATLAVLDDRLEPVPRGAVGELYVGGAGVARGYLGRPDLTADRFGPDPAAPGGRRYRTGDLVRRRDDGALEFVGRIDHQVKVRGHRIELAEIEGVLRSVPGVRDALAITRELRPGDLRLIGYAIGDPGLDRAALRAAAEAQLPAYARPTDLVVLADWPRSPAGKIDRDALPAPSHAGSAGSARSTLEFRLATIWQDVLGVAAIAPTDDFFAMGGHSLLAVRMIARIRDELFVDVPLSRFAELRTIAALAEVIASRGDRIALRSPITLRTGARRPLFLVPPVSGSALAYLPLLRRLSADRTVYAFHAPGLDGGPTWDRFEDIAAHFVRELLAVQKTGPFLLGGWSIGGALAVEMAIQLAARGHEVPDVVLIEANAPTPYLGTEITAKFGDLDTAGLAFLYTQNFGRCFGVDLGIERTRFAGLEGHALARAALGELRRVPEFPPDMDPAHLVHHLEVFAATARAFRTWQPVVRYRGRVTLFIAGEGHPEFGAARYDWTAQVEQPVCSIAVPGNHFSLVNEPHVEVLAGEVDRVLEEIP